jgi:hypothetical protein
MFFFAIGYTITIFMFIVIAFMCSCMLVCLVSAEFIARGEVGTRIRLTDHRQRQKAP